MYLPYLWSHKGESKKHFHVQWFFLINKNTLLGEKNVKPGFFWFKLVRVIYTVSQTIYFFSFKLSYFINFSFLKEVYKICKMSKILDVFPTRVFLSMRTRVALLARLDYLTPHTSLLTIRRGFAQCFVKYKKVHSTCSRKW